MTDYYYRVQITAQPEWEERICFNTYKHGPHAGERYYTEEMCPVGWEPNDDYIKQFGTSKWIEPNLDRAWRSRSSAAIRRDILEAAGYKAIIQRSAPIQWPADGEERISNSAASEVLDAMAVLSRAGLVNVDDLIRNR